MTFNVGHVEGGTGAGRKRPLRDRPKPWRCDCWNLTGVAGDVRTKQQPAHMVRCPVCKQERP